MWLKHAKTMPFLPPMTGNGKFIPSINIVIYLAFMKQWHCLTHDTSFDEVNPYKFMVKH